MPESKSESQSESTSQHQHVLIVGATSAIATSMARTYAKRGSELYLLGRDVDRLSAIANDLKVRGAAAVTTQVFDADNIDAHDKLLQGAFDALDRVDVAVLAHGTLPDQETCEADVDEAMRQFHTNGTSTSSLILRIANRLEQQRSGSLAVITSVAGDRGRRSNYIYGASKKMVSTLLEGLQVRLAGKGVHVTDIKPGFVDTPMTAAFEKNPLWAKPDAVAARAVAAIDDHKRVVYTPGYWAVIMATIRAAPHTVFRRLPI